MTDQNRDTNRDGPPVFLPEPDFRPGQRPPQAKPQTDPEAESLPQPDRGTRLEGNRPTTPKRRIPLFLLFIMLAAALYVSASQQSIVPFLIGGGFFVFYFRSRR